MRRSLVVSLSVTIGIAAVALGATLAARWSPKLGLDLAGGSEVVYKPAHKISSDEMNTTINIIRNRVDAAGVAGAEIGSQGGDLVAQFPGIKDPNRVIALIGRTAQLQFRPVLCFANPYTPKKGTPSTLPGNCSSTQYELTAQNLNVNTSTGNPSNNIGPDPTLASYPDSTSTYNDSHPGSTVLVPAAPGSGQTGLRYLLGPTEVFGTAVSSASAVFNTPNWVVQINLTGKGSTQWDALAQKQFHAYIAMDLDGQVESAPLTLPSQSTFTSFAGKVQVSGSFTQTQAQDLALVLNYGKLPVRLVQLTKTTVSASLGKSSLKAGLVAGMGGLILVLIYMVLYYRALGIVVICGLALTGAVLWGIVSALGHSGMNLTLDLAGVTGLIVSVGITADSYVIFFERLKDEVRSGRSVRTTVGVSFRGAFRTILAADLVSLLGAVVLWLLAAGDVRGFAFMLGLSTLLNIFTTFFFTRPFVILLGRSDRFLRARWVGVARGLALEGQV
jgi:preprotein translocase subunit SecD